MAHIVMGKPRLGEGVPLKDFQKLGVAMAVLGVCPGSDASAVLLCWTNPSGRFQTLDPAAMEIRLLAKLPSEALPNGASRRLVVPAARELLLEALAGLPPGCQTYAYMLDSSQGADYAGDPAVAAIVAANLERADHVLMGLPLAHKGRVSSNARSRSLKIGKNKKTMAALQTALAVFPQAQGRIRVAKHDWPLAGALLVMAHVIGATAHPIPPPPVAAAPGQSMAAAAAAAAAAGLQRAAGVAAAGPGPGAPPAAAAAGSQVGLAAAAAAAAAAGHQAASIAAVKEEPEAAVKEEPIAAVKEVPEAIAAAAPAVATPSQRAAPKRPMRGAGVGGRSTKCRAAAGAIDLTEDD